MLQYGNFEDKNILPFLNKQRSGWIINVLIAKIFYTSGKMISKELRKFAGMYKFGIEDKLQIPR